MATNPEYSMHLYSTASKVNMNGTMRILMSKGGGKVYQEGDDGVQYQLHYLHRAFKDLDPNVIVRVNLDYRYLMITFLLSFLALCIRLLIMLKAAIRTEPPLSIRPFITGLTSSYVLFHMR